MGRSALIAAVLVFLAGIALGLFALHGSPRAADVYDRTLPRVAVTSPQATTTPRFAATGSTLVIPALRVRAPLVPTGAVGPAERASLSVPENVQTVGWWDGTVRDGKRTTHESAPAPGQPGVAVVAGHIDSARQGPGALFELSRLAPGDTIRIVGPHGATTVWTVSRPPQTVAKDALPAALWSVNGPPRLAVVSCGGPFDSRTGHYLDNVIVWATVATQ